MTLTEFLLARIAEDEDAANCEGCRPDGDGLGPFAARRVLAESEAKRRIVKWHDETDDCCEDVTGPLVAVPTEERVTTWSVGAGGMQVGSTPMFRQDVYGCVTLSALAAVYSDHSDYDESWRP